MFRKSIIVATIIAIFIGSIGLPVTVHACRMMKRVTSVTCSGCGTKHTAVPEPDMSNVNPRISPTPCCSTINVVQIISSAVMKENRVPIVIAAVTTIFASYHLCWDEPASNGYMAHKGFRPPIDRQGQHIYLFNSLFLI